MLLNFISLRKASPNPGAVICLLRPETEKRLTVPPHPIGTKACSDAYFCFCDRIVTGDGTVTLQGYFLRWGQGINVIYTTHAITTKSETDPPPLAAFVNLEGAPQVVL